MVQSMDCRTSKKILVTSGPTRAYVDRIRYFANTSTGILGSKIVEALLNRGIPVVHLYGLGSETPECKSRELLESIEVITVNDVIDALKKVVSSGTISAVVHAMAVLDYVPESKLPGKKKSRENFWDIRLVRTPKIIMILRELLPDAYVVGFKLETGVTEEELVKRAGVLVQKYLLDMVVANDLDRVTRTQHNALFINRENKILARLTTKDEIAEKLADIIAGRFV